MGKQDKEMELRSEDVQDVMGEIPSFIIRWGITVIALIVITLIIGSYVFKYPDVVSGPVTLSSEVPPANVLARATGKIDQILVANNQKVKLGDPLAVIQNSAKTEDVQKLMSLMQKWKGHEDNIKMASTLFTQSSLQLGSIQTSYSTFLSALNDYLQYIDLHYYFQKIVLRKQQVADQRRNLIEMKKQWTLLRQQTESIYSTYQRDSVLHKRKLLSDESMDESKNKWLQNRQSMSALMSDINETEFDVHSIEGELLDLQRDYQESSANYKLKFQTTTEQLQTEIKTWERSFLLTSPMDGVVHQMGYWSVNQNVETGESIFSVSPNRTAGPYAKVLLPVQGLGKVRVGQRVNVRLNNFPDQEFGYLTGIVQHLSPTPDADDQYVAEIRFPKGLLTNYNYKLPITSQMTGTAEVITDDVRFIQRIFNPVKKVYKKYR
jgi:multidrug resistance efflux pump